MEASKVSKAPKRKPDASSSHRAKSSQSGSPPDLATAPPRSSNRVTNACQACRKRKTKCSGRPAPCEQCTKLETFCHFNHKLDTRRKLAWTASDREQHQHCILNGLLHCIIHNEADDVLLMIKTLRENRGTPDVLAKCLLGQIKALENRGILTSSDLDEDIIMSLAIQNLFHHRSGSTSAQASMQPVSPVSSEDDFLNKRRASDYQAGIPLSATHNGHKLQGQSISAMLKSGHVSHSLYRALQDPNSGNATAFRQPEDMHAFPTLGSSEGRSDHTDMSFASNLQLNGWHTGLHGFDAGIEANPSPDFYVNNQGMWNASLDLPLMEPQTPFSGMCLEVRDQGRAMILDGSRVDLTQSAGKIDCELLFREITSADGWSISNCACQLARRMPAMHPSFRIAMAVCMTRVLPFLIGASPQTLADMPESLQPTATQMSNPHDVSATIIPIPRLRDRMVLQYRDYFTILQQHNFKVNFPGAWGDLSGATLTEHGGWSYNEEILQQESFGNSTSAHATSQSGKAIYVDGLTKRHYITEEFQKYCLNPGSWSIDKRILSKWPELAGQLALT